MNLVLGTTYSIAAYTSTSYYSIEYPNIIRYEDEKTYYTITPTTQEHLDLMESFDLNRLYQLGILDLDSGNGGNIDFECTGGDLPDIDYYDIDDWDHQDTYIEPRDHEWDLW